jgi:hypothetical protein
MKCFYKTFIFVLTIPFLNILVLRVQHTHKHRSSSHYDLTEENEFELVLNQSESNNRKCRLPFISIENQIALEYIKNDYEENKRLFESCDLTFERNDLIQVTIKNDSIEVELQLDEFNRKFNTISPYCTLQRFDKPNNSNERERRLTYFEKYIFMASKNFKLSLNKHGFYLLECFNYFLLIKNIYSMKIYWFFFRKI